MVTRLAAPVSLLTLAFLHKYGCEFKIIYFGGEFMGGVFGSWANNYTEWNLSVIPCAGKRPIIKGWPKYCNEHPSDDDVAKWIKEFGHADAIGMPMGPANQLIAFDFDYAWPDSGPGRDRLLALGVTEAAFEIERTKIENHIISLLPNTPVKKVGKPGKWTAFFRPNGVARTFSCDRRGIRVFDVLYDGKQTILPPSVHPDTHKPYFWTGPDLLSSLDLLPALSLEKIDAYAKSIHIPVTASEGKVISGRNDLLKKAAFGFFMRGGDASDAVKFLMDLDIDKNSPPLFSDKSSFPKTFSNPEKSALAFAKSNYKSFKDATLTDKPKNGHSKPPHVVTVDDDTYQQIGFYWRYVLIAKDGSEKIIDVPKFKLMADYCFDQKNMCFDDSLSLRFDGKKWSWFSKVAFNNYIVKKNDECIKPGHIDGFSKIIKAQCFIDAMGIKNPEAMVNVSNGIIDVSSGALLPHSYQYLFKYCSPVDFDASAKCPLWDKFLNDTFAGNADLIALVQRLFGYILIGGRPFLHRAFVLYGNGRNGKSTFLDILRAVLGRNSYSVVSMAKIDKEFSVVAIDGKLANIVEETPTDEINAEAFKNLVGGGEVQAAHKGFDEYSFQCNARFVFACNDMPVFKDKSIGLEERLVFIPFERFLKEDERDTEMTEKLLAELPGIFNWAIAGAKVILHDRKLPVSEATSKAKEAYRIETDPLYAWFIEEIEVVGNPEHTFTVSAVYERYADACEDNGNRPYSKDKFSKRFRAMLKTKCDELKIEFDPDLRDAAGKSRIFAVFNFKNPLTAQTALYPVLSEKKRNRFN